MYECVITFPHSVDHGDLDSITRLTSLEHIRVVLSANARVNTQL